MKPQVYLGVDLGAESGRVSAGLWDGCTLRLEEVHRFPNGPVSLGGTLRWDVLRLWAEIQDGLALARQRYGHGITSVGVDAWGLDFTLFSRSGELLGLPFHYRDPRTRGALARAFSTVPREEIFAQTGIQFMEINSLYQLLAWQQRSPEILEAAARFLTIPDYFHASLSGAQVCEYSNATTTQCLHPTDRSWATPMLERFGLPTGIFPEVVPPGTRLGPLLPDVSDATGLTGVEVVTPASHDTGSAVVAVPMGERCAYLSSGTWSLLGAELPAPVLTSSALEHNFTNEGGVDFTARLLKNIMGLWLVQQCRRAFAAVGRSYDYATLVRLASGAAPLRAFVDPDAPRFLHPADMPAEIAAFCVESGQAAPATDGAIVRCAMESLALKYAVVLGWLEQLTGWRAETIHIVGGGAQNALLNQFTANACNRRVVAGPIEATVLGNLLVQARTSGELASVAEMRAVVARSFAPTEFIPESAEADAWAEARERFAQLRA